MDYNNNKNNFVGSAEEVSPIDTSVPVTMLEEKLSAHYISLLESNVTRNRSAWLEGRKSYSTALSKGNSCEDNIAMSQTKTMISSENIKKQKQENNKKTKKENYGHPSFEYGLASTRILDPSSGVPDVNYANPNVFDFNLTTHMHKKILKAAFGCLATLLGDTTIETRCAHIGTIKSCAHALRVASKYPGYRDQLQLHSAFLVSKGSALKIDSDVREILDWFLNIYPLSVAGTKYKMKNNRLGSSHQKSDYSDVCESPPMPSKSIPSDDEEFVSQSGIFSAFGLDNLNHSVKLDDHDRNIINEAIDAIKNITSSFDGVPSIDSISDKLNGAVLGNFKKCMIIIPTLGALTVTVIEILSDPDSSQIRDVSWYLRKSGLIAACSTILTLTVDTKLRGQLKSMTARLIKYVADLIGSFAESPPGEDDVEFTSQAGFNFQMISDIVAFILGGAIINAAPSDKMLKAFFELSKGIVPMRRGIQDMVSTVVEYFELAVNYFRDKVLGLGPWRAITNEDPEIRQFFLTSDEIIKSYYDGGATMSTSYSMRVTDVIVEGSRLLRDTYLAKHDERVAKAILVNLNELKKVLLVCTSLSSQASEVRKKPFCLLFRGPPGTGKSSAMNPICRQLAPIIVAKSTFEFSNKTTYSDYLYARTPGLDYWDGYNGQPVLLFDDFGAAKDAPGVNSDFLEFLRAANVFPWPLNMAELQKKGRYFFNSDLIVCSTNADGFKIGSLNYDEAVNRRFDMVFDVVPKLEFCKDDDLPDHGMNIWNRRLDKNKIVFTGFQPSIYEFHRVKLDRVTGRGTPTGAVYSYDELSHLLDKELSDHIDKEEIYLQTMKEKIDSVIAERLSRVDPKPLDDFAPSEFIAQGAPSAKSDDFYEGYTLNDLVKLGPEKKGIDTISGDKLARNFTTYGRRYILALIKKVELDNDYINILDYFTSKAETLKCDPMKFIDTLGNKHYKALEEFASIDYDTEFSYIKILCDTIELCDLDSPIKVMPVPNPSWIPGIDQSQLDAKMQSIRRKISVFNEKYDVIPAITAVLGLASWFSIGYGLYKLFEKPKYKSEAASGERSQNKPAKKPNDSAHPLTAEQFVVQSNFDNNTENVFSACVKNNVYEVYLHGVDERLGMATFLHGQFMVMPSHFMLAFKHYSLTEDEDQIVVVFKKAANSTEYKLALSDLRLCLLRTRDDLAYFRLASFPVHRDLRKFIYDGGYDAFAGGVDTMLACKRRADSSYMCYMGKSKYYNHTKVSNFSGTLEVQDVMRYTANTTSGDCGAMLLLTDKKFRQRKLIGFHIAGDQKNSYGLSSLLSFMDIEELTKDIGVTYDASDDLVSQSAAVHSSGFVQIGTHKMSSSITRISSIRKSKLFGKVDGFVPKTAPARLQSHFYDGEPDDPLRVAQRLYKKPRTFIREVFLEYAVHSVFKDLSDSDLDTIPCRRQVLSLEESVVGIPLDSYYRSIPRNTSPGFPWVAKHKKYGYSGKELYFGKLEDYDLNNEYFGEVKAKVLSDINLLSRRIRPDYLYADFPKDDRLPIAKVRAGKTRMISCADLSNTIIGRMYFMDFIVWLTKNKIFNGYCPGINCYSEDWDQLARCMQSKGTRVFDADYSKFDCSHTSQVIAAIGHAINKWYDDGEVNANIRNTYLVDLYNSRHIIADEVYEMDGSLPSGHPLTTMMNSVVNLVLYRMAWVFCSGTIDAMSTFKDHVFVAVFGDDSIVNVDDVSSDFFNQNTVSEQMTMLGYKYTPAHKGDGIPPPYVFIDQISFLKRQFTYNHYVQRYIAPLDLDVVLEIMHWTKKGDSCVDTILKDNIDVTVMELALYPKHIYERWTTSILRTCLQEMNYVPNVRPHHQALLSVLAMEARW